MPSKKYLVRDGFVVVLKLTRDDGSSSDRRYESGEEISLDDDAAALHAHKLEFASQKDRDAALAAETAATDKKMAEAAMVDPTVAALVAALNHMRIPPVAGPSV